MKSNSFLKRVSLIRLLDLVGYNVPYLGYAEVDPQASEHTVSLANASFYCIEPFNDDDHIGVRVKPALGTVPLHLFSDIEEWLRENPQFSVELMSDALSPFSLKDEDEKEMKLAIVIADKLYRIDDLNYTVDFDGTHTVIRKIRVNGQKNKELRAQFKDKKFTRRVEAECAIMIAFLELQNKNKNKK